MNELPFSFLRVRGGCLGCFDQEERPTPHSPVSYYSFLSFNVLPSFLPLFGHTMTVCLRSFSPFVSIVTLAEDHQAEAEQRQECVRQAERRKEERGTLILLNRLIVLSLLISLKPFSSFSFLQRWLRGNNLGRSSGRFFVSAKVKVEEK